MALYNPNHEYVLGNEWVPIRQPGVQFNRFDNPFEVGHTFRLNAASQQFSRGQFYLQQYSPGFTIWQPYTMNVYEITFGSLINHGDIRRCVIPVSNNITWTNPGTNINLVNANTFQQALMDPSHDSFVDMAPSSSGWAHMDLRFNVGLYNNVLAGNRILNVNFLYSGNFIPSFSAAPFNRSDLLPGFFMHTAINSEYNNVTSLTNPNQVAYPFLQPGLYKNDDLNRISLGDVTPFYGSNTVIENVNCGPWTLTELQRFDNTGSTGQGIFISTQQGLNPGESIADFQMSYAALEVFYCVERRVVYGTKMIGPRFANHVNAPAGNPNHNVTGLWWQNDTNQVLLRDVNGNTNPTLAGGEYLVTLMQSSIGDQSNITTAFSDRPPIIVAARQYYDIPGLKGYELDHPLPNDPTIVGKIITATETDLLPQMSIFDASNNVITSIHAYGKQVAADVYDSVPATQIVDINPIGTGTDNATYSNVRFYARRFGDGRRPLTLSCAAPTLSGIGKQVWIDAPTFDALPEIIDGWREVTLTFATPVTLGTSATGNTTWQFSSRDGSDGGPWQILGCSSISLSAAPTNNLQLAPAADITNLSNYGGTAVDAAWLPGISPLVTSATLDQSTDLTLMFFRDYSAPNFQVLQSVQALSGIGLNCGVAPAGVPTGLYYNKLLYSDSPLVSASGTLNRDHIFADGFQRTNTNSWGPQWVDRTGTTATAFQVNGSKGTIHLDTAGTAFYWKTALNQTYDLTNVHVLFSYDQINSPGFSVFIATRVQSATAFYKFALEWDGIEAFVAPTTSDNLTLFVIKSSGGVDTVLGELGAKIQKPALGQKIHMRAVSWFGVHGMKVWLDGDTEPVVFQVTGFDTTWASGAVGFGGAIDGGGTVDVGVYKFFSGEAGQDQNKMIIQRSDTVEPTFKTIMANSDLTVQSFNDYEARPGIPTTYRVAMLSNYNITGPFTTAAPTTIPVPGAVVNPAGFTVDSHILLFSTNSDQTGNSNLAYASVWTDNINEAFTFVEGGSVTLQPMYNKDFFTAFHATERGGDRFQRQVLVQAAAISPETLADFQSLRDMAWSDAPYICVRDEDGNRWLATVMVPAGAVTRNRTIYIANVDIVEVTNVPDQTDPGLGSGF